MLETRGLVECTETDFGVLWRDCSIPDKKKKNTVTVMVMVMVMAS